MLNRIRIDPKRSIGEIDRNIFGGFAEHLGRSIYGGIYEPGSPLADADGIRRDVLKALKRLNMPILRYPGGNFVSGYRWQDGVGPSQQRRPQVDLAWHALETNQFGTNEFVKFCRKLGTEPYLVVNCGDGDMREARDWVEYCNGTQPTYLVKQREQHGFPDPHKVRYWGLGNEVDGPWQIGYKTPQEYARVVTEYAKAMKWIDPNIKLIASAVAIWEKDLVERAQLIVEQGGQLIDYMGIHWYVGNFNNDFADYMTAPEILEERLTAYEGLIKALRLANKIDRPLWIAVDEWNVWYRTRPDLGKDMNNLEEIYTLEDALVVAMQLNLFIRHAYSVKMANIAQIVNVIAPIFTRPDGHFLQTIFYPFELFSRTCGRFTIDVVCECVTFSTGGYTGLRLLDVSATLNEAGTELVIYVVNRSETSDLETTIALTEGRFTGIVQVFIINGTDVKTENSFESPNNVGTREKTLSVEGASFVHTFEPHSVTALVCSLA